MSLHFSVFIYQLGIVVLLPRRVIGWIKGNNTRDMLKTVHDGNWYLNTKHRSWQKEAAYTCGGLTRLVISGQPEERRKNKKNDGEDEEDKK